MIQSGEDDHSKIIRPDENDFLADANNLAGIRDDDEGSDFADNGQDGSKELTKKRKKDKKKKDKSERKHKKSKKERKLRKNRERHENKDLEPISAPQAEGTAGEKETFEAD